MRDKKIVLVTGSTRGIGKEIAINFMKKNFFVILNSKEKIDFMASEFECFEGMYEYSRFDITNEEEVELEIEKIIAKYKKVDILVNNAGITRDKSFKKMDKKLWEEVIDVNLTGTFNVCKAIVPSMIENKYGRIINISSVIGLSGNFGQTNYAASKAGIIGFSKALALEVAKENITVNCVAPGFIKTDMTEKISERIIEDIISKIPLKRFGKVSEVAKSVEFLADSDYITGQTISVNGGIYIS